MSVTHDTTLALSGVFQGIQHVIDIADKGWSDQDSLRPLIASLLKLEADSCLDIYGSLDNMRSGLSSLCKQLRYGAGGKSPLMGRYVASVLNLERQLSQHESMLTVIAARITHIKRLAEDHDLLDDLIVKAIADLYQDTISSLPLRVQVVGKQERLSQPEVQNLIRTALFCSLRSAVLWRQMGGRRRQLILSRKAIIHTAEDLLDRSQSRDGLR